MRVSGAFVTRFNEEWEASRDAMRWSGPSSHRQVEDFLDRMKYDLAKVLFPEELPRS